MIDASAFQTDQPSSADAEGLSTPPMPDVPDFARVIPISTIEAGKQQQAAAEWGQQQQQKIADLWGQFAQSQLDRTVQQHTDPQWGDAQPTTYEPTMSVSAASPEGDPMAGNPASLARTDQGPGQPQSSPFQLASQTDWQSGPGTPPPTGPGTSGSTSNSSSPQDTPLKPEDATFGQQLLNTLRAAMGQGANTAGLVDVNKPPESVGDAAIQAAQAESQRNKAILTPAGPSIYNPNTPFPGGDAAAAGQEAPEGARLAKGLGEEAASAAGKAAAEPEADQSLVDLLERSVDAAKNRTPEAKAAVQAAPVEARAADPKDSQALLDRLAESPDLGAAVQKMVNDQGIDVSTQAGVARVNKALDTLGNDKAMSNIDSTMQRNVEGKKAPDNLLLERHTDALNLRDELAAREAGAGGSLPPEKPPAPPGNGADVPVPPEQPQEPGQPRTPIWEGKTGPEPTPAPLPEAEMPQQLPSGRVPGSPTDVRPNPEPGAGVGRVPVWDGIAEVEHEVPPPSGVEPPGAPPSLPSGRTPGPTPLPREIPPDIAQYLMRSAPQAAVGAATGGATYAATGDKGMDEKARIALAVTAGVGALKLAHVVGGGPLSGAGARATQAFIGSLIGPGTVAKKLLYDVPTVAAAPVVRGLSAFATGRFKSATPEAISAAGAMWHDAWPALKEAAQALNPTEANVTMGQRAEKDFERASLGQTASSGSLRAIDALTRFTQRMIQTGNAAANETSRLGAHGIPNKLGLPDPERLAKEMTFMGDAKTAPGEWLQKLFNFVSQAPGLGTILQPMKKVPVGILEQKSSYFPGLGLANAYPSKALKAEGGGAVARHEVQLVQRQLLGAAGVYSLATILGDNVNGAGPTNTEQRAAWMNEGNRPYSFRFPGTNYWYDMHSAPPWLSSPLQAYGDLMDQKREGGSLDQPKFDALLHSVLGSIDNNHALPNFISAMDATMKGDQRGMARWLLSEGSVPSWEMRDAAASLRQNQPDYSTKGLGPGDAINKGFQMSVPGGETQPAQDALGRPIANANQGVGAYVNPFHPSEHIDSPTMDFFAQSSKAAQLRQVPSSLTLNGDKFAINQTEGDAWKRAQGQYLQDHTPKGWEGWNLDKRQTKATELLQSADEAATKALAGMLGKDEVKSRQQQAKQSDTQQKVSNIVSAGGNVNVKKGASGSSGTEADKWRKLAPTQSEADKWKAVPAA